MYRKAHQVLKELAEQCPEMALGLWPYTVTHQADKAEIYLGIFCGETEDVVITEEIAWSRLGSKQKPTVAQVCGAYTFRAKHCSHTARFDSRAGFRISSIIILEN